MSPNRYLVARIIGDLLDKKDVLVATAAWEDARELRKEVLARVQFWSYPIKQLDEQSIVMDGGGSVLFVPLSGRHLEGKRADVWVLAGLDALEERERSYALLAARSGAARKPGAEVIEIIKEKA